jgi:hypothetical protein
MEVHRAFLAERLHYLINERRRPLGKKRKSSSGGGGGGGGEGEGEGEGQAEEEEEQASKKSKSTAAKKSTGTARKKQNTASGKGCKKQSDDSKTIDVADLTEEQAGLLHIASKHPGGLGGALQDALTRGSGARRAISYGTSAAAAATSSSKSKQTDFLGNPLSTPSPETVKFGAVSAMNALGFAPVSRTITSTVVPTNLWPAKQDRISFVQYKNELLLDFRDNAVSFHTTSQIGVIL